MKTGLSINPLLLSIMAQAAQIVKSDAFFTAPKGESRSAALPQDCFEGQRSRILTLSPNILKHPSLNKDNGSPIQPYKFVKDFDGEILNSSNISEKSLHASAVKFNWDPQWENVPQSIIRFITHPQRSASVWMDVGYQDILFLNEKWCHTAVQLGWSWWLTPPKNTPDLKAFMDVSKKMWRFWFTHPKSDQWVWPWANILLRECVAQHGTALSLPKPWITDSRNKNIWLQLETEAWRSLVLVVGGENAIQEVCNAIFDSIIHEKIDFRE